VTTVVQLVGAGPGDPDLLTLRAEAALAAATVVVSDAAVAHLAAAFAPRATVTVSPAGGPDPAPRDGGGGRDGEGGATVDGDAVRVMAGAARRGERVVRLYRGDPWLHAAFAVESAILTSAGVEHTTVPGPTVELAMPTAAGLAVHHRPLAVTVSLATPTALPPATDSARTLVTVTDDAAGLAARLSRSGDPTLAAAVVAAYEGASVVRRGTLAALAADPSLGGGVVVVGAVAARGDVEVEVARG
jgi:siroheme synthase